MVTAEIAGQSRLTAHVGRDACHDDERLARVGAGLQTRPDLATRFVRIPTHQTLRPHSGEEEGLEHHVLRTPPPPAVPLPSPRRSQHRLRRVKQLASLPKPTHELDILHQGPLAVATDRIEYVATNE